MNLLDELASLHAALTADDPKTRRQAAEALAEKGDISSLPLLCQVAVADRSLLARQAARQAVDKIAQRMSADLSLLTATEQLPLRPLVEGMESDHQLTREWAVGFLHPVVVAKSVRDEPTLPMKLLKLVQGRMGVTKVGWWAGLVLAELGERQAVVPLSRALRIGSDKVRRWLLQVVGEIGYERLVEFLGEALNERQLHWRQRREAARALGALGHPAALPKLQPKARFWSLEHWAVKTACRQAIQQIEQRGVATLPTSAQAPPLLTETLLRPASASEAGKETLPRPAKASDVDKDKLPRVPDVM